MASKSSSKGSSLSRPAQREHKSVEVRKISNGHIVTESTSKGDKYSSKETFHATKPRVDLVTRKK